MFKFLIITVLFSLAFAAPQVDSGKTCDASGAVLPSSDMPAPSGPFKYVGLGIGTQNYTCSAAGTYASAGAVASLYDLACLIGTPKFDTIQDTASELWTSASSPDTVAHRAGAGAKLGEHYFIASASGISPRWDFGSKGYVVGARDAGVPAPTGPQDVDWLLLHGTEGDLATQIYRVDTRLGQPPSSCEVGSELITVKYVSKYFFV
ncbi:hypothetical protein CYLTODRAFT_417223 [Cylindrobasidium torrendii FP15055 ss-10]|uniref:Malate dehydrogenase n=1 Tax=Cylindrobasidium torrendii FP15055 ss-10 TaxID=1314674 RepID=A0A0D7BSX3_9AGAR|nr:hypothetical protein CYLTODRAFT_417223 [Cylindrobasidium torrendii FP15055 ss-10]